MITVYHNPRCSKSREGLTIVQNSGQDFFVREYLKNPLTEDELKKLIQKLGVNVKDLVRSKEAIWKKEFKGKELSSQDILKAMVANPKLIERPIVENAEKAVIGRPTSNIEEMLA